MQNIPAIEINCSGEPCPLASITPHPKNYNQHGKKQIDLLATLIQRHGWRSPIIASKRSGHIIAGHGRYYAAQKLGCQTVPVDWQDFADERAELEHLIADNQIAELAAASTDDLVGLIEELTGSGTALDFIGMKESDFVNLIAKLDGDTDGEGLSEEVTRSASRKKKKTCPHCGGQL